MKIEQGQCDHCGIAHANNLKRFMCQNDECGKVVCGRFAIKGKTYNRPGELVHVKMFRRPSMDVEMRFCGTLVAVDDATPFSSAPTELEAVEDAERNQSNDAQEGRGAVDH